MSSAALADLEFGLRFAADRYRYFSTLDYLPDGVGLLVEMADERTEDATYLAAAASSAGMLQGSPTFGANEMGSVLGLGVRRPPSAASALFRVQQAERTLGRMAAQLETLAEQAILRTALERIQTHIADRRESVRLARRRAHHAPAFGAAKEAAPHAEREGRGVCVWFGTNRRQGGRGRFLGERADATSYGSCRVFVPVDRAMGSLGRGLIGRLLHGDNRVRLIGVDLLSENNFWLELSKEAEGLAPSDRQGLLFLHGYCSSFEDAARRTAQLKVDLAHAGPAGFFSWPSLGSKIGYTSDEAAIEGSEEAIRSFLVTFAEKSGASLVHIVAHSMGNRGLLRAMDAIAKDASAASPIRFGQIFLAAPDVDAQLFSNLASAYQRVSSRATLYVTSNDQAIGLSRRLHQYARVGLAPPVIVLAGIDTIDASHVNLGLIGHGYAAETRPVLADMHSLIQQDRAPDQRFGLRKAHGGASGHWEFVS